MKNELYEIMKDDLDLYNGLIKTLKEFFDKDAYLIDKDIHEQTISSKIACYLSKNLSEYLANHNLNIDCEYNKKWWDPKEKDWSLIRPDIIIHQRNFNGVAYNFIVFELKKIKWLSNKDNEKLKFFTKKDWEFWYKYWIWLSNFNFNKEKKSVRISIFIGWNLVWVFEFNDNNEIIKI